MHGIQVREERVRKEHGSKLFLLLQGDPHSISKPKDLPMDA